MKKPLSVLAFAALFTFASSLAFAGDLRLSIGNGRVTIVAQDVTLRQILDEWGRVGQTVVVGADKLVGPPVTLELHDVAEGRALETLLRSASGYIAKPRAGTAGASAYDRILIMPTSRPPAVSAVPQPFNARPQPQVVMPNVIDDDMESPVAPPGSVPPQPQMMQYPGQPPVQPPTQPGMNQPPPTMTAPRPGQLPAPPNVPGQPYQTAPPAPIRPPGVPPGPG
ncbi:MAG TPA: hypothetical protein VFJ02_04925, partial [Vicinamibacterales bacterium]|nr:hypothetical protein [Vicinamibacterales bacterium]